MFRYEFMQVAYVAATCIAVIAPILGLFLILRGQSLLADTLSHVSLAGVALGLVVHVSPSLMTVILVVVAAVVLEYLRQVFVTYSDVANAMLLSGGLALALVLIPLQSGSNTLRVEQYLFGSIVTISKDQLYLLIGLAVLIVVLYGLFRRPLYVLTFDEATAQTAGLPVRLMSLVFSAVTGVTISVMMPIAGALLVSAVLITPAAIAMRLAKRFTSVLLIGFVIALSGLYAGLYVSYHNRTAPGATVTLIFVGVFAAVSLGLAVRRWWQRRQHQANQSAQRTEYDTMPSSKKGGTYMTTEQTYQQAVQQFQSTTAEQASALLAAADQSVVVYIGRQTCPYCRKFAPKLAAVAAETGVPVYYVDSVPSKDATQLAALREQYGVATVPGLVVNHRGQVTVKCDSSLSEQAIAALIHSAP